MAHYSEMEFLFNNQVNKNSVTRELNNTSSGNTVNVINDKTQSLKPKYVIYRGDIGTNDIKSYLSENIYNNDNTSINPYIQLLHNFRTTNGTPGAGLRLRAADFAYLRDLGVYPINRMAILRRFPEGSFVPENLDEMKTEPISTIVSWIKPDQNFGLINFKENWTKTTDRFDVLLSKIIKKALRMDDTKSILPIPDFAQGMLFQFYSEAGLLTDSIDETYEYYDPSTALKKTTKGGDNASQDPSTWGLNKIPIGDPNVLREGPFRDPEGQNITSDFTFEIESVYEQKLLGDVDPGSAMLDILDNIYTMGTSNMLFYWGSDSPIVKEANKAIEGNANSLNDWWGFISSIMTHFWDTIKKMFNDAADKVVNAFNDGVQAVKGTAADKAKFKQETYDMVQKLIQTVLTSTISIWRFNLRGSMELMVGGKNSSTPWYLTLGNPNSPWLATNHIIVSSASVETSNEMGFNDQPQRLTAKFTCKFSRSLGKQELMRMFNNSFRRTYNLAPPTTKRQNNTATATYLKKDLANNSFVDNVDPPIVSGNNVITPGQSF